MVTLWNNRGDRQPSGLDDDSNSVLREVSVRHFVAYHGTEIMGHEWSGAYSFLSRRDDDDLLETIGEIVWVITGSKTGEKQEYALAGLYVPEQVIEAGPGDPDFKWIVSGIVGSYFDPPISLNSLPWFPAFRKSQGNFGFGINEIRDAVVIEQLTVLAKENNPESLVTTAKDGEPLDLDLDLDLEIDIDASGFEGSGDLTSHLRRERDRALVEAKKQQVLSQHGRLVCEVCTFDFSAFYGEFGKGYCEVHLTIPLASLDHCRVTKLDDSAIVCSNCHRVLHRNSPMPSISELRADVSAASVSKERGTST